MTVFLPARAFPASAPAPRRIEVTRMGEVGKRLGRRQPRAVRR
ncbi:hypothetical protein AKJ09_08644 [Labilithrix luteola]|uniref:Uncharacterized protein n=1 Tax=Labilithrix luteola TaxID=1391654 RepID=A0A0K1Q841_9BACT|nr:hypothetical protein AKJ09_08644 [Labilithrix luteola]